MPKVRIDYCSLEGAGLLCRKIKGFWKAHGHPHVKAEIVRLNAISGDKSTMYGVQSNLINGAPPR